MKIFIAIDDTDNLESIGTGRLSRFLSEDLKRRGLVNYTDVTRHQLLVHPGIPYTSHNSCACIAAETNETSLDNIVAFAKEFLLENFHEGANPGMCVAFADSVPTSLVAFGQRAQKEVIQLVDARKMIQGFGVHTWMHGETGQGCIGAVAGVGLRSTGDDGRFIDLEGIRDLTGVLAVKQILTYTKIDRVVQRSGERLDDNQMIDTMGWIRPSLMGGETVLVVEKMGDVWGPAEKKKGKSDK